MVCSSFHLFSPIVFVLWNDEKHYLIFFFQVKRSCLFGKSKILRWCGILGGFLCWGNRVRSLLLLFSPWASWFFLTKEKKKKMCLLELQLLSNGLSIVPADQQQFSVRTSLSCLWSATERSTADSFTLFSSWELLALFYAMLSE